MHLNQSHPIQSNPVQASPSQGSPIFIRRCKLRYAQTLRCFTPPTVILAATNSAVPTAQLTPENTIVFLKSPLLSVRIFPPRGEPVKAAIDAMAKMVPVRTPMSLMGEIPAVSTGVRPIPAPDPIPKRAAKSIIGTLPVAGSQRAKIKIVVKAAITIMVLNRPTLSAIALGTVRPNMLMTIISDEATKLKGGKD